MKPCEINFQWLKKCVDFLIGEKQWPHANRYIECLKKVSPIDRKWINCGKRVHNILIVSEVWFFSWLMNQKSPLNSNIFLLFSESNFMTPVQSVNRKVVHQIKKYRKVNRNFIRNAFSQAYAMKCPHTHVRNNHGELIEYQPIQFVSAEVN